MSSKPIRQRSVDDGGLEVGTRVGKLPDEAKQAFCAPEAAGPFDALQDLTGPLAPALKWEVYSQAKG